MKFSGLFGKTALLAGLYASSVSAQGPIGPLVTDPATGIELMTYTVPSAQSQGGFQFGLALPPTGGRKDEYIGKITGSRGTRGGYSGISHASGMTGSLLVIAWADGNNVRTSFRWAPGYDQPEIYTGNATLNVIASTVNATHYTVTYRCQWCWFWSQNGVAGSQDPTGNFLVLAWAQGYQSPLTPSNPNSDVVQHETQNIFFGDVTDARDTRYNTWASSGGTPTSSRAPTSSATSRVSSTVRPSSVTSAAPSSVRPSSSSAPSSVTSACGAGTSAAPTTTYDYIVVGAGAAGIPLADKLSESGKKVLLIEKGPPSSGRWGGSSVARANWKPDWLAGTNLTRFDVPGLCNQIWVDSAGIACPDVGTMAGCVLGGGTAINAALWWKAPAIDWDYNFPSGWKSSDMSGAVNRVFQRVPWDDTTPKDNLLVNQQGYNVITGALAAAGWTNVTANNSPDQKVKTFSRSPYMFSNGERGGPLATYLVTANARSNFKLIMNTQVKRVIRTGGHVTGVEVEGYQGSGTCGTINLTPSTGRVILSAGTFGSAKILFRSGIGPTDQLNIVNSTEGASMNQEWINLPVGYNVNDHTNTDVIITHPNVTFYDFYAAWTNPITADKNSYLNRRSGILAQAAPNINPVMWDTVTGADGITRSIQWTARVEGPDSASPYYMTLSQYLGRGTVSKGRTTINSLLNMEVSTLPYFQNPNDQPAVIQGIKNMITALSKNPQIQVVKPNIAGGETVESFVQNMPVTRGSRGANHWIGSARMGTDNGLLNGGNAVVDTNTRVYGVDNLHVVDASIFPGIGQTNPSALIAAVGEKGAEKILALPALAPIARYGQCGGRSYTGARFCTAPYKCQYSNPDYSQCN